MCLSVNVTLNFVGFVKCSILIGMLLVVSKGKVWTIWIIGWGLCVGSVMEVNMCGIMISHILYTVKMIIIIVLFVRVFLMKTIIGFVKFCLKDGN